VLKIPEIPEKMLNFIESFLAYVKFFPLMSVYP
jgi:hypothetical protein